MAHVLQEKKLNCKKAVVICKSWLRNVHWCKMHVRIYYSVPDPFVWRRSRWGPDRNSSEKVENGLFAIKTPQIFSVHTTPKEFQNAICVWGKLGQRKSHYLILRRIVFEKLHFQTQRVFKFLWFENFCGLKCAFKKVFFRDWFVWMVGLLNRRN